MKNMNKCAVWIEAWQMQCCGKPFSVGDTIKWSILKWENDGSEIVDVGNIDYLYDHHNTSSEELFKIQGIVEHIEAVFYHYEIENPANGSGGIRIPVSGKVVSVKFANGCNKDIDGMKLAAYYVILSDISIEAA